MQYPPVADALATCALATCATNSALMYPPVADALATCAVSVFPPHDAADVQVMV